MKFICKTTFEINEILIGNKGDILEVTNAIPAKNETLEDVEGYCDIANLTTNQKFNATWMDIDDTLEKIQADMKKF